MVDLDPTDPRDRGRLERAVEVETRSTRSVRSSWTPMPLDARLRTLVDHEEWSVRLHAAVEGDRLVGLARGLVSTDEPHRGWVFVDVDPDARGRGAGRALARTAEQALPPGVSTVVSSAYRRDDDQARRLVTGFAAPLGYTVATTETVVELDLDAARLPACPVRGDYVLRTHTGGVPRALREQVGRLKGLVDAEAPSGTLEWSPAPVAPEAYAAELAGWRAQGRTAVETLAVTPDGEVAAWTCVVVGPDPRRPAQVEGTLVTTDHRGRGLGAAVKRANLLELRARGDVRRVSTSSDDANRWMRAINAHLGFVPTEVEVVLQRARLPG